MTDAINTNTTDEELADLIRANFKIRDLVAVWYDEDDGKQFMIKGGLDVMGRQHLYIRGLTDTGGVAVQIIKMNTVQDIELMPEQTDPYEIEARIEAQLFRQTWNKSPMEEATLTALRAAQESADAQDSEGRAAGVREIEAAIWDADERALNQDNPTNAEAFSAQERAEDGLIYCGQCVETFRTYIAYWAHLDDHDMMKLGTME